MNQRRHSKFCRLPAFLLAVVLCLTLASPALAADDATASSIRLAKTEGTVSAANSAGRSVSLVKNLRLLSGYHVKTEASSYAWLNLDSAKLLKEDASSNVEVRKSGKKLEVLLSSGNLFFNVTEPLDDDETLNIRTSTTLTGVRGTCGWVEVIDRWNTDVYILEGKVECVVADPVTGENELTTISAGETATFTVRSEGASATNGVKITKTSCDVEDVPGYVLVELAEDKALCGDIKDASGLDILGELSKNGDAAAEAQRRLEEEEAAAASRLAAIAAREQAQASNVENAPYTPTAPTAPTDPTDFDMAGRSWKYDESTKTLHIGKDTGDYTPAARPPATTVDPPWYSHHNEIESIVVHEGVTRIGHYAFWGLSNNLTSVTIPSSVTIIGAFNGGLASADIYYGGSEKQWKAVDINSYGNDALKKAAIHYAGASSTPNTTGTTDIPGDLTMVGTWGWKYDGNTRTLYIGGSGAMDDYSRIGDIPWNAYSGEIESVVIGEGITRIGYLAFYKCSNLTNVTIPNGMTSIGNSAFYECTSLTGVTIPDGVAIIDGFSFMGCSSLDSVTIPNSVTSIGSCAFYGCPIGSVNIPAGVTSIGDGAFCGCSRLTSVTIPNGMTKINASTFEGCKGLRSITIPASVTSIEKFAFYNCTGLRNVYYSGSEGQWSAITIGSDNRPLTNATIQYNSN